MYFHKKKTLKITLVGFMFNIRVDVWYINLWKPCGCYTESLGTHFEDR